LVQVEHSHHAGLLVEQVVTLYLLPLLQQVAVVVALALLQLLLEQAAQAVALMVQTHLVVERLIKAMQVEQV
jgi:hypothetical protein